MKAYIIVNQYNEYLLAVVNGNPVKTVRKEHAKKFFDISEVEKVAKAISNKKNEYKVKEY